MVMENECVILQKSIEVDLLPGLGDPSLSMLPQQPFPRCAFMKGGTSKYLRSEKGMRWKSESFHYRMHTNPSDINIAGIDFLVTSG